MGCEKQLPGTAGRSQGLGFRTGVQAAGNACPSSGTEAFGMVLLQLFFMSTRHSTHDSVSPAGGWRRHLDSNSTKTVHGSGERGNWEAGGREERCWVPTKTP